MATADGLASVAFPAIGTGRLQYPRDLVARAMFDEVKAFSNASLQTSVNNVHFVVYDSDTETLDVSTVSCSLHCVIS